MIGLVCIAGLDHLRFRESPVSLSSLTDRVLAECHLILFEATAPSQPPLRVRHHRIDESTLPDTAFEMIVGVTLRGAAG